MNPWLRRALQVFFFEAIAIVLVTAGAMLATDKGMATSATYAVLSSLIAVIWNYVYNTLFEYWESKQAVKTRNLKRRIFHAIFFELGFVVTLVPLIAVCFDLTLAKAFVAEIGLMIFFLVYSITFNWAFDQIVGLPRYAAQNKAIDSDVVHNANDQAEHLTTTVATEKPI